MFEYMDGIVDAVKELGQAAVDVAVFVTICTAKAVLIITAPVWILPYAIWRKGRKQKYRQWKKNYKKKHGVNPPLWLDRKKRRRYIRKRVRRIAASLEVNVEIITKGLEASVMAIKKRLIELQERIVVRESEAVEND